MRVWARSAARTPVAEKDREIDAVDGAVAVEVRAAVRSRTVPFSEQDREVFSADFTDTTGGRQWIHFASRGEAMAFLSEGADAFAREDLCKAVRDGGCLRGWEFKDR